MPAGATGGSCESRAATQTDRSRGLRVTKCDPQANECLTALSLTVSTQRHRAADFLPAKCDFTRKTYDIHLRLIGKRVVDFLLVLIELSLLVLRLRRNERISVQNRRFRSNAF